MWQKIEMLTVGLSQQTQSKVLTQREDKLTEQLDDKRGRCAEALWSRYVDGVHWPSCTATRRDLGAGQVSGGEGLVDTQQVWEYELYQFSNDSTIKPAHRTL